MRLNLDELLLRAEMRMQENPYSPPTTDFEQIRSEQLTHEAEFSPWICATKSLLFSIPGGVTAGVVWGSGALQLRIEAWLAYLLIGAFFGLCIAFTLRLRQPHIGWMQGIVVVVGGSLEVGVIRAANQAMRAVGWHLVGQQFPWIWAISTMLPILASVGIGSLTLRVTRILSWKQTAVFAILTLPVTAIAWGAIDEWMLPNNSMAAHYRQRVLMFIAWFVLVATSLSHFRPQRPDSSNEQGF